MLLGVAVCTEIACVRTDHATVMYELWCRSYLLHGPDDLRKLSNKLLRDIRLRQRLQVSMQFQIFTIAMSTHAHTGFLENQRRCHREVEAFACALAESYCTGPHCLFEGLTDLHDRRRYPSMLDYLRDQLLLLAPLENTVEAVHASCVHT